jgi:serine/threonine protein kinase
VVRIVPADTGVALQMPELLGGRYRLEEPIGTGGMGRVYRAHDELLDRPVAIKLLEHSATDPTSIAEARAAAGVSHPGIVHVFDVGVQDETGYIVMELVDGRSLRDVLRERGNLPPGEAADIASQVADALHATHGHGLVHCDIKPLNIILTPTGHTKLVDFGIAREAATERADDEEIRGSIAYVAPEQARGESVDGRTDVYALGAVLYEMLVGRQPFSGASTADILAQRLVSDPVLPRRFDARIPQELQAVVMRALAREPARRYADAGAMSAALRSLVARPTEPSVAPTQKIVQPIRARSRRVAPRAIVIVGAFIVVIALAIAGWRMTHSAGDSVPRLVGLQLSEVPMVLEQAGISPADAKVLTRPVPADYVGRIVDQQPQPGLPLDPTGSIQIAIGVPE